MREPKEFIEFSESMELREITEVEETKDVEEFKELHKSRNPLNLGKPEILYKTEFFRLHVVELFLLLRAVL